jgi:uncharacterized protein (TIGR00296 family)
MPFTATQGRKIVRLARDTLDYYVKEGKSTGHEKNVAYLSEKRGVFVTLNTLRDGKRELRGCVGFPYPVKPLSDAVVESTIEACSADPRFNRVVEAELKEIVVEVSVLTVPETLKVSTPLELPKMVRIGTDGLIVASRWGSGLLLPQVARELQFGSEEFLTQTCLKAGLMPDAWLTDSVQVQSFQAEIFGELSPSGLVKRLEF